tara:strand:- start:85669 stop:86445 length:777 start_codon:yes stop_codon:yes gene_type:complete
MALKIQELELQTILQNFMAGIKADYDSRTTKTESVIGQMFNGLSYDNGKYDLFAQAVSLFITRMDPAVAGSPRKVSIRSYYDKDRENVPTMHIAAPSEQEKDNWIGGGFVSSTNHAHLIPTENANDNTFYEKRIRRYQTRIAIIFTSDNWIEVQLMYFLVKYGILAIFDTLILDMFQNPHVSGHELKMNDTAAGEHFYSRSIIIDSANEAVVPNFHLTESFSSLVFPRSNDETSGAHGDGYNEDPIDPSLTLNIEVLK